MRELNFHLKVKIAEDKLTAELDVDGENISSGSAPLKQWEWMINLMLEDMKQKINMVTQKEEC